MLIVKVKICGLTNYDDAAAAMDMGADMLGFNFYPKSPRYIEPAKAAKIISRLPAFTDMVGVFVNESVEQIHETRNLCRLDWIQLHGDEDPAFCNEFRSSDVKVMKAIRVKDQKDVEIAENFFTDAILLDAFNPKKYGGTGVSFDWNIIGHIDKRVFLAGGINPGNAAKAVELGVYGIDVCSGIEIRPGKKDRRLMKKLFENIRQVVG
jgi:phosphoribosylanthranilate isomerase